MRVQVSKCGVIGAVVLVASFTLTGCASGTEAGVPVGDYPEVSLAESKSSVQLVRNAAADRIPAIVLEPIDETRDESEACLSASVDPQGYIRAWHSTILATSVSGSAWRVDAVASNLVESYTDDGWTATVDGDSTLLSNDAGTVKVVVGPMPTSDTEAQISVDSRGPCVVTDGAGSDEVTSLEGATAD